MDTDGVINWTQRAGVLRGFISRLEREAADVLEAAGRQRAAELIDEKTRELSTVADQIAAQQAVVREKIAEAVEAIRAEAELRGAVEELRGGAVNLAC
jgi:hypothetical protein